MKTYQVTVNDFEKECILNALMEKAHQKGICEEARSNYMQVYGDFKDQLK